MCNKFKQMFPCIGPKMFTGPHTPACLSNLWKKSGCTGDLNERVTDQSDYNWWNSNSYGNAATNMKGFVKTAKESSNYKEANITNKKCFGKNVDACENRFKPRPLECSKKIYQQSGLNTQGKLNPANKNMVTDGYIRQLWKNGQNGEWSVSEYLRELIGYKRQNIHDSTQPKKNFDRYMHNNMLVKGNLPQIPWEKPCWNDFIIMMSTSEYSTIVSNGNLSFSGGGFKSILPTQNSAEAKSGIKKGMHWVGNYELKKEIYELKYFPFWQFVKLNKKTWNSQWNKFKSIMTKSPSVKGNFNKVNSQWLGWDPIQARRRGLQKGQGDCDNDRDCGPGLKCAHDKSQIPGIRNTGLIRGGRDFCYDPADSVLGGTDGIIFLDGSNFDTIIETKNSLSQANQLGNFYRSGNNRFLTKNAYMHEHFPYWTFIRRAQKS